MICLLMSVFCPKATICAHARAVEKLFPIWTTLGRFDVVVVAQMPDAMAIRAVVAAAPKEVASETPQAFSGMSGASDIEFEAKFKTVIRSFQGPRFNTRILPARQSVFRASSISSSSQPANKPNPR